jgi:hypothetical protein
MQQLTTPDRGLRARLIRSRFGRLLAATRARGEDGMAIAEYAIGILIVAAVGLVIFTFIRSGVFSTAIQTLIEFLLSTIQGLWT